MCIVGLKQSVLRSSTRCAYQTSPEHMYSGMPSALASSHGASAGKLSSCAPPGPAMRQLPEYLFASMVHFSFATPAVRASLCMSWHAGLLVEGAAAQLPASHWAHQVPPLAHCPAGLQSAERLRLDARGSGTCIFIWHFMIP